MEGNPFKTETYKLIFSKFMADGESTCGDEVLVDMEEPRGAKISSLPATPSHHVATCKAFVTTTTAGRLLVAVFNLYGKFYECYQMQLGELQNIVVKKAFGGMNISFYGNTQFGRLNMKLYIPNHQFGTDLKAQKNHLKSFAEHLSADTVSKKPEEKKATDEILHDKSIGTKIEGGEKKKNPMQELFDELLRMSDILDENGIDFVKHKAGTSGEHIDEIENTLLVCLPEDYKNLLRLSNGLSCHGTEIYPIEHVRKIELPDNPEWNQYYSIGSYIGDGSLLFADSKGGVYYGDHVTGIEETTFMEFLNTWLLDILEDDLAENGLGEK
ncbi:MAG: SMI1/KNR4 family protein [Clostridium sp.]|nr:SMI1/KNR4 family protein [Clostridium sp.]